MYVSAGGSSLPTEDQYIWRSSKFGNDVLKISYEDEAYCTSVS